MNVTKSDRKARGGGDSWEGEETGDASSGSEESEASSSDEEEEVEEFVAAIEGRSRVEKKNLSPVKKVCDLLTCRIALICY